MLSALVAAAHYLAAFGVAAAVFCEWLLYSRTPTHADARRIQRCDAWYGLSSIALIVAGLLRVYFFEKGSAFYLGNGVFVLKIALFAAMGLLSIYPTTRFIRWRADTRAGRAPAIDAREFSLTAAALKLELVLIVAIVMCASLMAKGIGR
jgi:putative membrane protein